MSTLKKPDLSDPKLRAKLAKNSRRIVESDMENKKIFSEYLLTYNY